MAVRTSSVTGLTQGRPPCLDGPHLKRSIERSGLSASSCVSSCCHFLCVRLVCRIASLGDAKTIPSVRWATTLAAAGSEISARRVDASAKRDCDPINAPWSCGCDLSLATHSWMSSTVTCIASKKPRNPRRLSEEVVPKLRTGPSQRTNPGKLVRLIALRVSSSAAASQSTHIVGLDVSVRIVGPPVKHGLRFDQAVGRQRYQRKRLHVVKRTTTPREHA